MNTGTRIEKPYFAASVVYVSNQEKVNNLWKWVSDSRSFSFNVRTCINATATYGTSYLMAWRGYMITGEEVMPFSFRQEVCTTNGRGSLFFNRPKLSYTRDGGLTAFTLADGRFRRMWNGWKKFLVVERRSCSIGLEIEKKYVVLPVLVSSRVTYSTLLQLRTLYGYIVLWSCIKR